MVYTLLVYIYLFGNVIATLGASFYSFGEGEGFLLELTLFFF